LRFDADVFRRARTLWRHRADALECSDNVSLFGKQDCDCCAHIGPVAGIVSTSGGVLSRTLDGARLDHATGSSSLDNGPANRFDISDRRGLSKRLRERDNQMATIARVAGAR
jgi:hypothetical protein